MNTIRDDGKLANALTDVHCTGYNSMMCYICCYICVWESCWFVGKTRVK